MNQKNIASQFSPIGLFGGLPVFQWRFTARFLPDARLPRFLGSAWRGMIGWQLQRLTCPFTRRPGCSECSIKDHCPYFLLFEHQTALPGLARSPKGYVFYPPLVEKKHEEQALFVTLFGDCTRFAPVIAKALFVGQSVGLGKGRHPYEIVNWREITPKGTGPALPLDPDDHFSPAGPFSLGEWVKSPDPVGDTLSIRLQTPVRLRKKGKYLGKMNWPFFFATLIRRAEALNRVFNQGDPMGKETWQAFQQNVTLNGNIRERLSWWDLSRYSSTQKQKMPQGGLVGDVTVTFPDNTLIEWWKTAELLHVGKNASMGLGRVEILGG